MKEVFFKCNKFLVKYLTDLGYKNRLTDNVHTKYFTKEGKVNQIKLNFSNDEVSILDSSGKLVNKKTLFKEDEFIDFLV